MRNVSLFSFLILLLCSGCEEDSIFHSKKKTKLLTNKNWVISGHTTKENNNLSMDVFATYAPCSKDDFLRFTENGFYELSEGPTKCKSGDPQVAQQGTWSLSDDKLEITKLGSSSTINYTIRELTKSKLVISTTDTQQGDTLLEVLSFTAL